MLSLRHHIIRTVLALLVFGALAQRASAQIDFWERAGGPYGGTTVWDLVQNDSGHLFAATANGVFRSQDDGSSWTDLSEGLISVDIRDLHILDNGTIWAASYGAGLFKLTSGSEVWQFAALENVFASAIEEPTPGTLLAGANGFVYRSLDGGSNWSARSLEGFNVNVQDLSYNSEYYFAATSLGIFRSNDQGENWEFASFGLQEFDVRSIEVNEEGHVFAGANSAQGGCSIYRSRGNGSFWTCIQPATSPLIVGVLKVGPGGDLFAGGFRNLFQSHDEGSTWSTKPASGTSIETLIFTSSSTIIGTRGLGLYKSQDGGASWASSSIGIQSKITSVSAIDDGRLLVGTEGGLFESTDLGFSWDRVHPADPLVQQITDVELNPDGQLIAATKLGVWKHVAGTGWEALGPPGMPSIRDLFIRDDGTILAAYHAGVYILSGSLWVDSPIKGSDMASRDVSAVMATNTGAILAGAAWDSWRRESGSTTWELMSTNNTPWFDVQSFGSLGDRIIGGTRFMGVVESFDDGLNWHPLGSGLVGSEDIQDIEFNIQGVPHISTFGSGIFQLNPWSRTWLPMNNGLQGHHRVTSLAFDQYGNSYAGTLDAGLFRHIISGVATDSGDELPSHMRVGPAFPNPASSYTTLPVDIASPGTFSVEVFDILGRKMASQEDYAVGESVHVRLNVSGMANGLYVFRVHSGQSIVDGSFSVIH